MKNILPIILLICAALPSLAGPDYYLTGSFNDWKPNQAAYKFKENGDIYTLKMASLSGDFKITTSAWEHQYGCATPLGYGKTYKCVESGNAYNMTLASGTGKDITITFDNKEKTIRVDGELTLYLIGEFNDWLISPVYAFIKKGEVYELRTADFTGNFKVVSADNSFSLSTGGKVRGNSEMSLENEGKNMQFDGIGSSYGMIRIIIDPNSDHTLVESSTILSEKREPEYYNLQGVKVNHPEKGIYIKVTGSESEKILIP